jgi:hypothetical protein
VGGILAGALWILSLATNGFYNFFSDQPAIQLLPFALVLCIVILAALHKYTGGYSKNEWSYRIVGIVCLGIMAFTSVRVYVRTSENRSADAERKEEHAVITNIPGQFSNLSAAMVVQQDYIGGTRFTHKKVREIFPFGYAVIYFSGEQRFRYETFRTGLIEWTLDWNNVKIEPDFSAATVHWTIPTVLIKGTNVHHGSTADLNVGAIETESVFKAGAMNRVGIVDFKDDPVIYVGTLSDNQRSPVFVIGFRIVSDSERPKRPNRPGAK